MQIDRAMVAQLSTLPNFGQIAIPWGVAISPTATGATSSLSLKSLDVSQTEIEDVAHLLTHLDLS